jgi:hypothetical protein
MVIRFVLAAVAFLGVVVLIARAFRPQLEGLGRSFVAHFGLGGMALGLVAGFAAWLGRPSATPGVR